MRRPKTKTGTARARGATAANRGATVLICVLACLGIVIALVLSTLQNSLRERRQVRMQRQLLQTDFLCQAGVQRSVQQRKRSSDYVGETWTPRLGIASFQYCSVEIRIQPTSNGANPMQAEVIASLASSMESNDRMQRSHSFTIHSSDSSEEAKPKP